MLMRAQVVHPLLVGRNEHVPCRAGLDLTRELPNLRQRRIGGLPVSAVKTADIYLEYILERRGSEHREDLPLRTVTGGGEQQQAGKQRSCLSMANLRSI